MAMITASAMRRFDKIADSNEWLQWFLPLVLASGGNTGSQSATLVIRAMAVSRMTQRDRIRIAIRELCNGLILGLSLGLFSWLALQGIFQREPIQATAVALTIAVVVTMGSLVGSLLPILFDRLGMDPAIMSNPLIASLSDLMGVVIYFSIAILLLF